MDDALVESEQHNRDNHRKQRWSLNTWRALITLAAGHEYPDETVRHTLEIFEKAEADGYDFEQLIAHWHPARQSLYRSLREKKRNHE